MQAKEDKYKREMEFKRKEMEMKLKEAEMETKQMELAAKKVKSEMRRDLLSSWLATHCHVPGRGRAKNKRGTSRTWRTKASGFLSSTSWDYFLWP